jgi:hypothetical protein
MLQQLDALSQAVAARVLADVVQLVQPVIERFRTTNPLLSLTLI